MGIDLFFACVHVYILKQNSHLNLTIIYFGTLKVPQICLIPMSILWQAWKQALCMTLEKPHLWISIFGACLWIRVGRAYSGQDVPHCRSAQAKCSFRTCLKYADTIPFGVASLLSLKKYIPWRSTFFQYNSLVIRLPSSRKWEPWILDPPQPERFKTTIQENVRLSGCREVWKIQSPPPPFLLEKFSYWTEKTHGSGKRSEKNTTL